MTTAVLSNTEQALSVQEISRLESERLQKRENISRIIRYIVLFGVGILMLYPLIWMVFASFKPNNEIFSSVGLWSNNFTMTGFIEGWKTGTEYTFATYLANSFKFVIPKVILTVISSTIVAYGFARFEIPGKKIWFACLMATVLLPQTVLLIPQYIMFREFNMLDSYMPLYLPSAFATQGFFVFMLIQFLRGVPTDMEQAAQIDGCNTWQTLIYIVVPILKPAIISVALFQFMWSISDFMGPLIYISSVENYPVSLALKMSIDVTESVQWNQILAMSTISLIPSIAVFFGAQKYFVEGVSSSGIKG